MGDNMIDIIGLLNDGQAAKDKTRAAEEVHKTGALRIGSSGVVCQDGTIRGTCHRKAVARLIGREDEKDRSTKLMFQTGELVEEGCAELLNLSGKYKILRSHDLSVDELIPGTNVKLLGRPDIVLADKDSGKPIMGIEHKTVFSTTTAAVVWFERMPKPDNLAQCAAYSHYLKIPFALVYSSPSYVSLGFDSKKYGTKSVKPFYRVFYTEWRDSKLYYRADDRAEWTESLITTSGVTDYFSLVAEMREKKSLGPRHTAHYLDGTPNKWGADADCKFCFMRTKCDDVDDGKIKESDWFE